MQLLLTLAVLLAGPPQADDAKARLEKARAAAHDVDFERALRLAREALESGGLGAGDVWATWALIGQVSAAMGYDAPAVDAFARALNLFPAFELPVDASPKVAEPFREAKERAGGARLAARVDAGFDTDGLLLVKVEVLGDKLQLVRSARLWLKQDSNFAPTDLSGAQVFSARKACPLSRCELYVELVDDFGNAVWRSGGPGTALVVDRLPVKVEPAPQAVSATSSTTSPWPRRAALIATTAALAIAAGICAGLYFRDEARLRAIDGERSSYTVAQAMGVVRDRDVTRILTWSFIAGAAAGGMVLAVSW